MESVCSRPAFAKVNLHLAVGLPREDGYHPIQSIFTLVDLKDEITLSWEKSDIVLVNVQGLEAVCNDSEDTMTKAVRLWHEAGGPALKVSITCRKQIPCKAGLGGGSSDAAAVLRLLQQIDNGIHVSEETLFNVALKVGCDVPFFLSGYRAAYVTGIGERVVPWESKKLPIVLVMPSFFDVSTSSAYRGLDSSRADGLHNECVDVKDLLQIYKKSSQNWNGSLYNDFQPCSSYRSFYDTLEDLSEGVSGFGSMSGSGACWFFVSEDVSQVRQVRQRIVDCFGDRVGCWLTHTMA